ncbi:hypothetical protein [Membranihabitans marinus]|uniref:hypothetical protein n=1 Tax=Membranihabitans marinus TaxID=1227546 RepID=UPI001F1DF3AD|nr:hypothetical protein [Membranihabitans marinus]
MLLTLFFSSSIYGSDLYIGRASADITPELPVALMGQFHLRIAREVVNPLTASAIALETKSSNQTEEMAIFVSCDLIWVSNLIISQVRDAVVKRIPGFDSNKIIINATHTHTGPVIEDESDQDAYFYYNIPKQGVTQVSEYRSFLVAQLTDIVVKAWTTREKGSMTWGIRRAAIPYNRRVVYKDGEAVMYGKMALPNFDNIEGYEDHDVQSLFYWNLSGTLLGMSINVACPAQIQESDNRIDADYWHSVRQKLGDIYGTDVVINSWAGAAGDQSPRAIYRKQALQRMIDLSEEDRTEDVAQRIVEAVTKTHDVVKKDAQTDLVIKHSMEFLSLPKRIIAISEYVEARQTMVELQRQITADPNKSDQHYVRMTWNQSIVERYEAQKLNPNPYFQTEVHVLRIGDIAIWTNQFELFTDYGIQVQVRSKALQTFAIQLAGPGSYLPTEKAVAGGGYSAVCQSNIAGPEGGQILVEYILESIDEFWN